MPQARQTLPRSAPSSLLDSIYSHHDSLFADKVMREADWTRHRRSTQRHRLQPWTLVRVMLGYLPLLVGVAVLSVAVGVYDLILVQRHHWPMLSGPAVSAFFTSITTALSLLLVFKTNSSYARWWEARRDVGQLVSLAHNIVRQAVAYLPPHQAPLIHATGRWAAASMYAAKASVRTSSTVLGDELEHVLLPAELEWLLAQPHKCLAVGQALSAIVQAAEVDSMTKTRLDGMVTLWTFEFGACGRIFNTAIPSAYSRHTSRFLLCYIFSLPLLLWPLASWGAPALAVVISFLLLGVENIGAAIEQPFFVIAFDTFCGAVHRDILAILAMLDAGSSGGSPPVVGGLSAPDQRPRADAAAAAAAAAAAHGGPGAAGPAAAPAAASVQERQQGLISASPSSTCLLAAGARASHEQH